MNKCTWKLLTYNQKCIYIYIYTYTSGYRLETSRLTKRARKQTVQESVNQTFVQELRAER